MRPHQIAGYVAAFVLFLGAETSATAQGTDQQREACTPDVFRLCGSYIPDADRIVACLRGNPYRLSAACYGVLYPQQTTSLRRSQRFAPVDQRPVQTRPQDDDD